MKGVAWCGNPGLNRCWRGDVICRCSCCCRSESVVCVIPPESPTVPFTIFATTGTQIPPGRLAKVSKKYNLWTEEVITRYRSIAQLLSYRKCRWWWGSNWAAGLCFHCCQQLWVELQARCMWCQFSQSSEDHTEMGGKLSSLCCSQNCRRIWGWICRGSDSCSKCIGDVFGKADSGVFAALAENTHKFCI